MTLPIVDDGQFRFTYRCNQTGETKEASVDLLLFRLACEELETKHNLRIDDQGCYVPTEDFLLELAARLAKFGTTVTPYAANRLWCMATEMTEALKKNMSQQPISASGTDSTPANSAEKNDLVST